MAAVSISFDYADVWLRQVALERAREGSLDPTWRDRLPLFNVSLPPGAPSKGFEMAIEKIRRMPYAAWEPDQTPDWLTALGVWYIDSRSLLTQSYTANMHQLAATMVTANHILSHDLQHPACDDQSTLLSHLLASEVSIDEKADSARNLAEQSYIQTRDRLTASYLAGRAAGGQEIDWVRWFKARVARWPPDEPRTRRANIEINSATFCEQLERLPKYWIS